MIGLSFVFGVAFATQGLWLILPFAGLELVAVAIAFFVYGRRAADFERITLVDGQLDVERVEGARTLRWEFPAAWTRVEVEDSGRAWMHRVRVFLVAHGKRIEVGRHLPFDKRKRLAGEIFAALRNTAAT